MERCTPAVNRVAEASSWAMSGSNRGLAFQIRNHFHSLLAPPQRQFHRLAAGQFHRLAKLFESHLIPPAAAMCHHRHDLTQFGLGQDRAAGIGHAKFARREQSLQANRAAPSHLPPERKCLPFARQFA